jgi:hypothetical protein
MTKEEVVALLVAAGFVHENDNGWANTYVAHGATEAVTLAANASRLTLAPFTVGSVYVHSVGDDAVLAATGATLKDHLKELQKPSGDTATVNPSPAWRGDALKALLNSLHT